MIPTTQTYFIFSKKTVHFADAPFDVNGCDYVVFPFCKEYSKIEGFTCKKQLTSIIDLTQDLDDIWNNMDRKSTRYCIKKAKKNDVEFAINAHFDDFLYLYNDFVVSKNIKPRFEINIDIIKTTGTLFVSKYNGEILGGNFYLEDENHMILLLSGSKRLEADKDKARLIGDANRLIHWEAIQYGKNKGILEYDFGGLWPEEEVNKDPIKKSINSFKKSFGGRTVTVYNYEKTYSISYKIAIYVYNLVSKMRF